MKRSLILWTTLLSISLITACGGVQTSTDDTNQDDSQVQVPADSDTNIAQEPNTEEAAEEIIEEAPEEISALDAMEEGNGPSFDEESYKIANIEDLLLASIKRLMKVNHKLYEAGLTQANIDENQAFTFINEEDISLDGALQGQATSSLLGNIRNKDGNKSYKIILHTSLENYANNASSIFSGTSSSNTVLKENKAKEKFTALVAISGKTGSKLEVQLEESLVEGTRTFIGSATLVSGGIHYNCVINGERLSLENISCVEQ